MKQLQTSNSGKNCPEKPGIAIRREGKKQENEDSLLGLKNPVQEPQLKRTIRGVQRLTEDLEWAK